MLRDSVISMAWKSQGEGQEIRTIKVNLVGGLGI